MSDDRPLRLLPADPWAEWRRIEERRARRSVLWLVLAVVAVPLVIGLAVRAWGEERCPAAETAPARASCHYGDGGVQDAHCTPGAVMTDDREIICHQSTKKRRCTFDAAFRARMLAAYGVTHACEFDHLISLELGGSNEATNVFPQIVGCAEKDKLENRLHAAYCKGEITLEAARAAVLNWDWKSPRGEWQSWSRPDGGQ